MHPDLEEEPVRQRLDFLINQIAIIDQRYARWGIRSLDITPQKDIVLGMNDSLKVRKMIDNGWIAIPIGLKDPLRLAVGPLVSQGIINHRRYEISCRYPPRGIPLDHILDTLRQTIKVKEVRLGNVKVGTRSAPVSKGGFTIYAEFPSTEDALF